MLIRVLLWLVLLFVVHYWSLVTLFADEPPAKGIQDNSFLIEEAYNQEPGVVQHILNVPISFTNGERQVTPIFTQEWPFFSQTHQLSYTIPYVFTEDTNGIADIRLNYRFQALMEGDRTPAFAPRFTLVTPAGDAKKSFGHDRLGFETNLPFSKIVGDRWTVHFNAGGSTFPDVKGHDLTNFLLGGSSIYAVGKNFNLMLECVAVWEEDAEDIAPAPRRPTTGKLSRSNTVLISPGTRYAWNLNDAQIVAGLGVPIGVTDDSPDVGLFFYFSFEHSFVKADKQAK